MCLEVRANQKKTQFIVLPNWNSCGMCPYEKRMAYHNSKWQAEQSWGKHDGTNCYGLQRKKSCHGGKKGDAPKIVSGKSAMKWISKNLPYGRW